MDGAVISPNRLSWIGHERFSDTVSPWLHGASDLGTDVASVRIKVMQLTQLIAGHRERAVACHNFVRSLKLQFGAGAPRSAAQTLHAASGTALEKSDLLIALLRCCGIPARLRIYSLRANAFRGLTAEDAAVLHPVVEVHLESRWMSVDTHHMDVALALGARSKLIAERQRFGYGVHLDGAASWDGQGDALASICPSEPETTPLRDCGAFYSVAEFAALAAEFTRFNCRAMAFAGMRASNRASKLRARFTRE